MISSILSDRCFTTPSTPVCACRPGGAAWVFIPGIVSFAISCIRTCSSGVHCDVSQSSCNATKKVRAEDKRLPSMRRTVYRAEGGSTPAAASHHRYLSMSADFRNDGEELCALTVRVSGVYDIVPIPNVCQYLAHDRLRPVRERIHRH